MMATRKNKKKIEIKEVSDTTKKKTVAKTNKSKTKKNVMKKIKPLSKKSPKISPFNELDEHREILGYLQDDMRQYYPWANTKNDPELFSEEESITPLVPHNKFPVIQADSYITKDKSREFSAILSEKIMYFVKWNPILINENSVIGMQSDQLAFRKNYKTAEKWGKLLDSLLEMKNEIYVSNIIEIPQVNIATFQLAIFDPLLLQPIDFILHDLSDEENKEYADRMKNGRNRGFMFGESEEEI